MGGRSSGNLELSDGGAERLGFDRSGLHRLSKLRFRGTINLNGGGFSSFRKSFSTDLSSYSGLWVEADVVTDTAFHTPLAIHVQLGGSEGHGKSK